MTTPLPTGLARALGSEKVVGNIHTAADVLAALTLLSLDGIRLEDYDCIMHIDFDSLTIYPKENHA